MPSRSLAYPVFDADNHLYETREAFLRYLPDKYKGAIDYVDVHGRTKIVVRGHISDYIPNPTFDRVGRPGAQEEYFKVGNPDGKSHREIIGRGIDCPDSFRNAEPRVGLMDEQGLNFTMMFPTLASLVEERMRDDPDLTAAVIHALNQWMVDEWPYFYQGRMISTPVITCGVLDHALKELDYIVSQGAKCALVRPAPAWGYRGPRSPFLPEFDPLWKRFEEAGLILMLHASDSGYTRWANEWEGDSGEMLAFAQPKPFGAAFGAWHREICDTVTSLICHGMLWRFPKIKAVCVENGAGWVPGLMHSLELAHRNMPQAFDENPLDTFRRNVYVHPFHEEDPRELVKLIGADRVCFGSDFPHVEGLADPISYVDELAGLPDADIAKIMGGNLIELFGLAAA